MGDKSTKTTTSQQTSNTTTPLAPSWATDSLQDYNAKVNAFGNTDATSLVAPETALQKQAATSAGTLGSLWQPQLAQSNNAITGVLNSTAPNVTSQNANSQSLLDGLSSYYNPYTDQVVNSTLADFDANAGQTTAAQAAKAAANGAFGGSRYGIQEAQTIADLARARASTESGLRNTAFNTATTLSGQDADRRQTVSIDNANAANAAALANAGYQNDALNRQLQAAGLLGSLGQSADALASNDINQQAAQGANERAIDGSYRTADLDQLQALGALLGQGQFGLLTGQQSNGTSSGTSTQTQSPGLLGSIGQGAQTAAALGKFFL